MSTAIHSLAPWTFRDIGAQHVVYAAPSEARANPPIVCLMHHSNQGRERVAQDMRLIAAAPDLLAALQHLMRYDFGNSDGAKEARAAIAKATIAGK